MENSIKPERLRDDTKIRNLPGRKIHKRDKGRIIEKRSDIVFCGGNLVGISGRQCTGTG